MDSKKLLFIYNPYAGKGIVSRHLQEIKTVFQNAGFQVTVYETKGSGDGDRVVAQHAKEYDRVVCAGGDGTLSGIVNGMMQLPKEDRKPIGFLPVGSTNDTGKSYGLPSAVREAAKVAAGNCLYATDVGRFNDRYFIYVASLGKLSAVSCFTPQELKKKFGYLAYLSEGIKSLLHMEAYDLRVFYKDAKGGHHAIGENFFLGMITNSLSVGGFKGITGKSVDLHDGLFEVILAKRPHGLVQFGHLVDNLLLVADKDKENMMTHKMKAQSILVESDEDVQWVIDGEDAGKHKRVEIENMHKAIELVVG